MDHANPHFDEIADPMTAAGESRLFHDEFDPPPIPNHLKSVYSDGREIGGLYGSEADNRYGDKLGDCSADAQSAAGARMLADLERASRLVEQARRN